MSFPCPRRRPRPAASIEPLEPRALLAADATILHDFAGRPSDGKIPTEGLTLLNNKLYGVTQAGGANDDGAGGTSAIGHKGGTIYSLNLDGSGYQVLHEFGGTLPGGALDGYEPIAQLTAMNGKLYGTTPFSGPGGVGTIFSINADGSNFTTIHAFGDNDPVGGSSPADFDDGGEPFAPLTVVNNKLYGVTAAGGRPQSQGGANGLLFSIDPDGSNFTKVHPFDFHTGDATYNLGLVTDGTTFYGVTSAGGAANAGRIYAIGVDGSNFRVLKELNGASDGFDPLSELTLVNGNLLVGTAGSGGANGQGTVFTLNTDGSNFTVRNSFSLFVTGAFPHGEILRVGDKLYGTTTLGGSGFSATLAPIGVVYSLDLDGSNFQIVHTFNGLGTRHVSNIYGQLVSDGVNLYGASGNGGTNDIGTVWSIPLTAGNDPTQPAVTVALAGAPITNNQSAVVDFGSIAKGKPQSQKTFTVSNTGGSTLSLGAVQLPAGYVLVQPLVSSLAPGASDTFTVGLSTAAAGTFSGNVTFTNNDGGIPGNTFHFPVSGVVTGTGAGGGGGGGNTGTGDLVVQLTSKPPANAVGGSTKTTLKLKLRNQGTGTAAGNTSVTVYLSSDAVQDGADTLLTTFDLTGLSLKARQSKVLSRSITLPSPSVDGSYRMIAVADPNGAIAESNDGNNSAVTNPFALARPSYNLTATARPMTIKSGKASRLSLTAKNTGNTGVTNLSVPFRAIFSSDGIFDDNGETTLLNLTLPVSVKAKKTKAVKLSLPGLTLPVGKFSIRVLIDPDSVTADADRTDNTVTVPVTVR